MEDDIINCGQFTRKETQLMCPWISAAPIGCTSIIKPKQTSNGIHKYTSEVEPTIRKKIKAPKSSQQQRPVDTANHFYYFLKLMQTFPDVHPATLHSVMCLSGNNFSAACETLVTARNYKENYMQRKMQVLPPRYHPYQKHLQAQTSNGQLYDIVSIVSNGDNAGMPNIQYSLSSNEANQVILVSESKKMSEEHEEKDLNVKVTNELLKEATNQLEYTETEIKPITEQKPEVELDQC